METVLQLLLANIITLLFTYIVYKGKRFLEQKTLLDIFCIDILKNYLKYKALKVELERRSDEAGKVLKQIGDVDKLQKEIGEFISREAEKLQKEIGEFISREAEINNDFANKVNNYFKELEKQNSTSYHPEFKVIFAKLWHNSNYDLKKFHNVNTGENMKNEYNKIMPTSKELQNLVSIFPTEALPLIKNFEMEKLDFLIQKHQKIIWKHEDISTKNKILIENINFANNEIRKISNEMAIKPSREFYKKIALLHQKCNKMTIEILKCFESLIVECNKVRKDFDLKEIDLNSNTALENTYKKNTFWFKVIKIISKYF